MTTPLLISVEGETLELVTEALRAQVSRLQRAATIAAGELEAEVSAGVTKDRRPASVRITKTLADAARLESFARELALASTGGSIGMPDGSIAKVATNGALDVAPQVVARARAQAQELHEEAAKIEGPPDVVADEVTTIEVPVDPDDPGDNVEDAIGASEEEPKP